MAVRRPGADRLSALEAAASPADGGQQRTRFDGWIDGIQGGMLIGWAADRLHPSGPAHLVFALGDQVIGIGRTDQPREDVTRILDIPVDSGFAYLLPQAIVRDPATVAVFVVDPDVARRTDSQLKKAGKHSVPLGRFKDEHDRRLCHQLSIDADALTSIRVSSDRVDLRARAQMARASGQWASAAFFLRKILSQDPENVEAWMRHGHALARIGLLDKARVSYERAKELAPDDPGPPSALSSLSIARGRTGGPSSLPRTPDQHDRTDESALRHVSTSVHGERLGFFGHHDSKALRIYFSSIVENVGDSDLVKLRGFLGSAHYSYSFAMSGYIAGLEAAGLDCTVISHPEYWQDIRTTHQNGVLHFGHYPPERPRFLKGAHNITCVAWEFERLRTAAEANSYHAFSDPASMLRCSDEVWSVSTFGADALLRSGVESVSVVPTPVVPRRKSGRHERPRLISSWKSITKLDRVKWINLAIYPGMQSLLSRRSESKSSSLTHILLSQLHTSDIVLFYTVLNVHDYRKQIRPLLEAFIRYSQGNRCAYLLLKLNSAHPDVLDINTRIYEAQIFDAGMLVEPFVSDRIVLTSDTFSRDELNALSDISSFYVCTSHGEGQNLPLIEAMGSGVVPISVDHTAMRDYISGENSITIRSKLAPMTPRLSARYEMYGASTYFVDARDVYDALKIAAGKTEDEYRSLSDSAVSTVKAMFGVERLVVAAKAGLEKAAAKFSLD